MNRDPRFYRDIIYPGAIYQTITYSPQEGGSDEINNSTLRDGKKLVQDMLYVSLFTRIMIKMVLLQLCISLLSDFRKSC